MIAGHAVPVPPSSSAAGASIRFMLFAVAAGLFFVLPALLSLAADWQWFSEVGYLPILQLSIAAHSLIGAAVFAVAAGWLTLNLRGALAGAGRGTAARSRPAKASPWRCPRARSCGRSPCSARWAARS